MPVVRTAPSRNASQADARTLVDEVLGEDAAEGDVLLGVRGRAVGGLLPALVHAPVVEAVW